MATLDQFVALCEGSLNPNNEVRAEAERHFTSLAQNSPAEFVVLAAQLAVSNRSAQARSLVMVMLRRYLSPLQQTPMWDKCPPAARAAISEAVVSVLARDPSAHMRSAAGSVAVMLALRAVAEGNQWPELMSTLAQLSASQSAPHRGTALAVYGGLAEYAVQMLHPHMAAVVGAIQQGFSSGADLQVHATGALHSLLLSVEDHERPQLAALSAPMFAALASALAAGDELEAREMMQTHMELFGCVPKHFRAVLGDIVTMYSQVASEASAEIETRVLALSALLQLGAVGEGMVRRHESFARVVVPLAFQFLLLVPASAGDVAAWTADLNDTDYMELAGFSLGVEAMDRLALALGGRGFMTHAMPIISELAQSGEWSHRHAAMFAISESCEGCVKVLRADKFRLLDDMVRVVFRVASEDPHPRVRWAALNAVAQMSTDFPGAFQERYAQAALPVLLALMAPAPGANPRVMRHAALALVDFCGTAEPEHVLPHAQHAMQTCAQLITSGEPRLQEAGVTVVAAVAPRLGDEFARFYPDLMPVVVGLFAGNAPPPPPQQQSPQQPHAAVGAGDARMLRARAMECVGMMAEAVGKEQFAPHAEQVMSELARCLPGLSADDPQQRYLVEACARIALVLEEDSAQFAQHLVPMLLRTAARSDDQFLVNEGETHAKEDAPGYEVVPVPLRGVGGKKLIINTSLIEERVLACRALYAFVTALGARYAQWIEQTVQIMLPLVVYPFNEEMRASAIATLPALLGATVAALEASGQDTRAAVQLWGQLFPRLVASLETKTDLAEMDGLFNSLAEMIAAMPVVVPSADAVTINTLLVSLIKDYGERAKQRAAARNSEDFDEVAYEEYVQAERDEAETLGYLTNVTMALLKNGRGQYLATMGPLSNAYRAMLEPNRSVGELCAAVCAFAEMFDNCPAEMSKAANQLLPVFVGHLLHEDEDVRHAVAFAVGVCGVAGGAEFAPKAAKVIEALVKAAQHPSSSDELYLTALQNYISATGKILLHHGGAVDSKQLLPMWLQMLPVPEDGDETEACTAHATLLKIAQGPQQADLFGDGYCNLPRVLSVFAAVIGTDVCDDETAAGAKQFWKAVAAQMPASAVQQLTAAIGPEAAQKLQ